MDPPEKEREDDHETQKELTTEPAPEVPVTPPKPELYIIDFAEKKINPFCTVCGLRKERYLEVEVKGVIEYTCKDCYNKSRAAATAPVTSCRSCGAAMHAGDNFCGKCGNPALLRCSACGNEADEEDRFCAKCGAKLFAAD